VNGEISHLFEDSSSSMIPFDFGRLNLVPTLVFVSGISYDPGPVLLSIFEQLACLPRSLNERDMLIVFGLYYPGPTPDFYSSFFLEPLPNVQL
jgi:hypothetical protein